MSTRAEALAQRIEQGAKGRADFAAGLTDAQWNTIVKPDGRKVGVTIHHVASVYPIEIHLASEIAAGNDITGVTWPVVAEMNAKHSLDNASAEKAEALELLRANSQAAADAVRGFTDEQLDRATLNSLYNNAPVTAQFMIEDHALRHSWHHLGKIKAALENA